MAYDRFMIAPLKGLQTNRKPWAIMDESFAQLNNAYAFRDRIRKRFGSTLMGNGGSQELSRLRVQVGTYAVQTTLNPVPGTQFNIGQMFSVGTDLFTVYQNGAMLSTNPNASGTFDTSSGVWSITYSSGAPTGTTPVFWYPALPVMGLCNYESGPINNQPSYAFDTEFAYKYANGWSRSGTLEFLNAASSTASLNYVWTCNWEGITDNIITLFATNFQVSNPNGAQATTDDPIWYTPDGTNWFPLNAQASPPSGYVNAFYFLPSPGTPPVPQAAFTGPYVMTAKIIVAFKDRLLLLNTIENNNPNGTGLGGTNTAYTNRCRFSFNGSPFAQNAWYEPDTMDSSNTGVNGQLSIAAGAGFIDATTHEQIVSAEFIKDRLIVYFERSTWELAYTGSDKQPFLFQKLNTELGADSTFSVVPFDTEILCVSNVGIHQCNGSNVSRIDDAIPDQVFEIRNESSSTERVAGVRDYYAELVYWTFPYDGENPLFTYNNKILVYNYRNGTWAIFDDCVTVWGEYEQQSDITWQSSSPLTWEQANMTWNSGVLQAQFRQIIAGNQEGFTFIVDIDVNRNAPSLQITNLTLSGGLITLTIIDHTLTPVDLNVSVSDGDFILIENCQGPGMASLNGQIFPVNSLVVGEETTQIIIIAPGTFSGTYTGGGTVARVSNPQIMTKQFNPYDKSGHNVAISKVDFLVTNSEVGAVTVDFYTSATNAYSLLDNAKFGVAWGNGTLETGPYPVVPYEAEQDRLWHPVYIQAQGECVQLAIYMSFEQMLTPAIALAPFEIHAMTLYLTKCGRLQ